MSMKAWRAVPMPLYVELALAVVAVLVSVLEKQKTQR
jgi:hypothetical protein